MLSKYQWMCFFFKSRKDRERKRERNKKKN